jgi:serine/threonine-protein kinase
MRELKSGADTVFRIVIPDIPPGTGAAAAVLEGLGALSKFSNPFIAAVKDRGFAKGVFFSVQEYCAGMTAAAAVKKSGPLPESKAVDAALGILSALESPEAAGQDAPHGFLSPDGVLLPDKPDTDGPVKIIDFGLTQAFGAAGPSSPEPPAGLTLFAGARTVLDSGAEPAAEDVRDCAALLYFMLSGFYPRDPEEGKDPWLRVIQASPVPLAERAPGLPPGLCAAVDAALAENGDPALKTVPGLTAALREATRR